VDELKPRRVSVIVPTRDRPDLLRQALASIREVEAADLALEIIVGDNGCAAENKAVADEFGALYAPAPVPGAAAARNAAMECATGEFWAFLDDDDMWLPEHVRPHLALMDARPDIDAVFGQFVYVDRDLQHVTPPLPERFPHEAAALIAMLSGYFPQIGAVVVRASAAKHHGLMDVALLGDQDWDWQLRFAASGAVGFVSVPSVQCRVRPPSQRYDYIQMRRTRFTRRVFMRHALPNWRRFASPWSMLKAYYAMLTTYYDYFYRAVIDRADSDRSGARRALFGMFRVNPVRALKAVFEAPLRTAAWRLLQPNLKLETGKHRELQL
jgi:glycosyltransferase involved in cell wall biosynthesis